MKVSSSVDIKKAFAQAIDASKQTELNELRMWVTLRVLWSVYRCARWRGYGVVGAMIHTWRWHFQIYK